MEKKKTLRLPLKLLELMLIMLYFHFSRNIVNLMVIGNKIHAHWNNMILHHVVIQVNKFLISLNPSHAAIKISINATAAVFICKNIFPTPVQVKKIIKIKIGDIQQIHLYQNVCKFSAMLTNFHSPFH